MQMAPANSNLIANFTSISFQNTSPVLDIMSALTHSISVKQLAVEVSQGSCVLDNIVLTSCSNIQQWIQTLCTICGLCLKQLFDCNTHLCGLSPRRALGNLCIKHASRRRSRKPIMIRQVSSIHTSSSSFHVTSGIHASSYPFHVLSPTTSHHRDQHFQKV